MISSEPTSPPRTFGPVHVVHESLTGRERQVVELIAEGLSNREIAEELFVSINSVKTYIRSAYRTLGVTRRSQAVIWAVTSSLQAQAADEPAA